MPNGALTIYPEFIEAIRRLRGDVVEAANVPARNYFSGNQRKYDQGQI
jgi:hypothetical protein